MKSSMKPKLYIIAGPNGAGKTTFATGFLPKYAGCFEFVNADLIAQGLSPFNPACADLAAGKLMLEQIRLLAQRKVDFAFETTLSGKIYVALLEQLKEQGYHINLFFLWLPDVRLAIERIAGRVKRGGHDVPINVVKRRFGRGVKNFFSFYKTFVNFWAIFDNSGKTPLLVAYEEEGEGKVFNQSRYIEIMRCGIKK
jgi:predicted ABC-type ATPase